MKVIGMNTKYRVIELFLTGDTMDEIVQQLPVSKGSVVSIVSDFREGRLRLPDRMTAYVDELRRLVVDMKKKGVSLTQLKSYERLYSKLQEMGAGNEEAEGWLDTSRDIASSTDSDDQFIRMISDLVKLSLNTGMNVKDMIKDYHEKLTMLPELDRDIQQKKEGLNKIKVKYEKQKIKAKKEMNSLVREIAVLQNRYRKQKRGLQIQLDEYMAQNRLSWKEVNTVQAILKDKLNRVGLGERDIDEISKEIVTAGSLSVHIGEKQTNIERFRQEERTRINRINSLINREKDLDLSIKKKRIAKDFLDEEFEEEQRKMGEIERMISDYSEDLTACRLIIEFLASPESLIPEDFTHLQATISRLRAWRFGAFERISKAREKNALVRIMPSLSRYMDRYRNQLEKGREQLAYYLLPIFQDKVMFVKGYGASRMGRSIRELRGRL